MKLWQLARLAAGWATNQGMIDHVNRDRPWTGADRTGGPVDEVFDKLRRNLPGLIVERLEATCPADDDNVYFIGD
jgi:hypothetical protein